LANADARAANDSERCLALNEVQGGYPRYHIVEGRRCWYASTRGPEAKPTDARPVQANPAAKPVQARPVDAKPVEIDPNPYDDPIWQEPDAGKASAFASRAKHCEEQALKLDLKEKRAFMKQCMAN
jgi:hypothetical protein